MRSWSILAVAVLLLAGVAVGAWLLLPRAGLPAGGLVQSAPAGELKVIMRVDEAAVGTRAFDVVVEDRDGRPSDVAEVKLRFTMTEMDMGVSQVTAQRVGAGHYQARGPYFTMVGDWNVDVGLLRDGQAPLQAAFRVAVAAPGEASGPLNPLVVDAPALQAGRQLYAANCVPCHGVSGRGDGPNAAGLNPRPADFSQHMIPGKHTDGQVFLWIRDGFPGTAMPAWKDRLGEQQIWQLVIYLRTFGQPGAQASTTAQAGPSAEPQPTAPSVPSAQEPLPPLVFARQGNLWRSDGSGAPPRQLTSFGEGGFAEYPTLSPDGARIAFVLLTPPPMTATLPLPSSTLMVMNADGGGQQTVWKPAQGQLGLPAWAKDGRSLYVAGNGADPDPSSARQLQIFRLDLDGGARQALLDDVLDPTLSPDGSRLAYLKLGADGYSMSLMVAAPDGSGAKEIVKGDAFQGFYAPRFSPDGRRIVVAAIGGPETDSQGNPRTAAAPSLVDGLLGLLAPPAAEAHGLPWDLWVVDVDGSGLRRLAAINEDLPMAAFSPDGQRIAVQGGGGIYLMDSDGRNLRKIDPIGDHGGLDWAARR